MLNVHLNYKPPSSWRILFLSGGYPRQFSRLKKFRALVVPGGVFHKGTIIPERQLNRRFSCGRPVMTEKKRGCTGSFCPCTHTDKYYVRTDGQTVYLRDQKTRTPLLANPPIQTTPPGNLFNALLHRLDPLVAFLCVLSKKISKHKKTGLHTNLLLTYDSKFCSLIIINPIISLFHDDLWYVNYNKYD